MGVFIFGRVYQLTRPALRIFEPRVIAAEITPNARVSNRINIQASGQHEDHEGIKF